MKLPWKHTRYKLLLPHMVPKFRKFVYHELVIWFKYLTIKSKRLSRYRHIFVLGNEHITSQRYRRNMMFVPQTLRLLLQNLTSINNKFNTFNFITNDVERTSESHKSQMLLKTKCKASIFLTRNINSNHIQKQCCTAG